LILLLSLRTYFQEQELEALKKYKIDIADLNAGEREYEFTFDDDFFQNFEYSIVQKGNGIIKVLLNKTETFIELSIHITGQVELVCDRSLDVFDFPINIQKEMVVKFSDDTDVEDDDVIFISWNAPSLNLAQHFYELLAVEIPMKKLHPRFDQGMIDDELVYSSDGEITKKEDEVADPRWNKLKELKRKK
jgi:uncharacterized metal-binding protein YceD (DUF177 family)